MGLKDIIELIEERQNSEFQKKLDRLVAEEARETLKEVGGKSFQESNRDLSTLAESIRHRSWLEKNGINYDESKAPEVMKKYLTLEKSSYMTDELKKKFLFPYLMEKRILGIETEDDRRDLDDIIKIDPKNVRDPKTYVVQETFTRDVDRELVFYESLGLLDDEDGIIKNLPNCRKLRNITSLTDFEVMAHGASVAKKLGLPYKERYDIESRETTSQEGPDIDEGR